MPQSLRKESVFLFPTLIRKHWIHFVIWSAMLAYVIAVRPFYTHFILKDGKPVSFIEELPQRMTKRIAYEIERVDPVVIHGQNIHEIWGWSFIKGESDQSIYERFIVLQSRTDTYFFAATNKARPDIQAQYADLQLDLSNAGFSSYISKDLIKRGTYQIGILLKNKNSGAVYYLVTHKSAIKTANKFQLIYP